ncbi:MAG: hypothetical protein ACYCOU_07005 [Sulfobacillus sp.]
MDIDSTQLSGNAVVKADKRFVAMVPADDEEREGCSHCSLIQGIFDDVRGLVEFVRHESEEKEDDSVIVLFQCFVGDGKRPFQRRATDDPHFEIQVFRFGREEPKINVYLPKEERDCELSLEGGNWDGLTQFLEYLDPADFE